MLHADNPNPNAFERLRRWLMPLVDRLNMDPKRWVPLLCVCLGYKTAKGKWGGFVLFGDSDKDGSLYHNGAFFLRVGLPFWIGSGLRWTDKVFVPPHEPRNALERAWFKLREKQFWQGGAGWKRNGQLGLNFRFQSDDTAAAGTTGPNFGQAVGWAEGHK